MFFIGVAQHLRNGTGSCDTPAERGVHIFTNYVIHVCSHCILRYFLLNGEYYFILGSADWRSLGNGPVYRSLRISTIYM
jgi:hypothetical protein